MYGGAIINGFYTKEKMDDNSIVFMIYEGRNLTIQNDEFTRNIGTYGWVIFNPGNYSLSYDINYSILVVED